jgi:hypothetical protein
MTQECYEKEFDLQKIGRAGHGGIALRRWRQEDDKLEAGLSYIARSPYQKN